jgi:energy-coupling factor transporter transmembrane protein EcfT
VERSQQTGLAMMIGAGFILVAFFTAMMRRSYMAVALPVLSALTAVSAIAFWIGWTMFQAEDEDEEETPPAA